MVLEIFNKHLRHLCGEAAGSPNLTSWSKVSNLHCSSRALSSKLSIRFWFLRKYWQRQHSLSVWFLREALLWPFFHWMYMRMHIVYTYILRKTITTTQHPTPKDYVKKIVKVMKMMKWLSFDSLGTHSKYESAYHCGWNSARLLSI